MMSDVICPDCDGKGKRLLQPNVYTSCYECAGQGVVRYYRPTLPDEPVDPVVEKVRADLLARSQVGIKKYGTTLDASGLSEDEFMQHAYEEVLDLANYLAGLLLKREAKKWQGQT